MPGTTATQGLIYPVGTDRMCDGALQFEVLAKGMSMRYAVLESTVDLATEPAALLVEWFSDSASEDPLLNGNITWNTVQVDDAGAYDAGLSVNTITLPYVAPGQLWEIGMFALGYWDSPCGSAECEWRWDLRISNSSGTPLYDLQSTLTSDSSWGGVGGGSHVVLHETTGNDVVAADWTTANNGDRLRFAQLWAYRIGEA